jgi:hypothetical protein
MSTKREQVLTAIRTALTGTTGVGTRIYRSRVEPLARAESPALIVEPISDTPAQNTSLPTLDWSLGVRVVVIIRNNVPDQAADPIIDSLHSKLMADLTLGGIAIDIQPGTTEFTLQEGDTPIGVIFCSYLVRYRTDVDNLSTYLS